MPKKIATENVNAKLGIVMRSGKALLGKTTLNIRIGSNIEGHKEGTCKDGYCLEQLS